MLVQCIESAVRAVQACQQWAGVRRPGLPCRERDAAVESVRSEGAGQEKHW